MSGGTVNPKEIEYEELLGRGSYGDVHRAKWNNRIVAVKTIDKNDKSFDIELSQLKKVDHPNIIKVLGTVCEEYVNRIILEYAECGSLEDFLHCNSRQYSWRQALSWLQQIAEGVAYLHSQTPKPLLHRDIKPANLLLTENFCKILICDFGTVVEHKTSMTKEKGTVSYTAPEVFQSSKYNEKCDVYSWGIVLWEIRTRKQPFEDDDCMNRFAKIRAICEGKRPDIDETWDKTLKDLMRSCWHKDPAERPTMQEVLVKLRELK